MEIVKRFKINYPIEELKSDPFITLIQKGLQTSTKHDHYLNQRFNKVFLKPDHSWIITQNQVVINQWFDPLLPLTVTTQVTKANRFFIQRYYEYLQNNQLIATMTAQFVAIDLMSRRLVRLNEIQKSIKPLVDTTLEQTLPQLNPPLMQTVDREFKPTIHEKDIDGNHHVNNLVYLKWVLNDIEFLGIERETIQKMDLKYSRELMADDLVHIKARMKEGITDYCIYKKPGDMLAAYIQITYK